MGEYCYRCLLCHPTSVCPGERPMTRVLTEKEFSSKLPQDVKDRTKQRLREIQELIDTDQWSGIMHFTARINEDLTSASKVIHGE